MKKISYLIALLLLLGLTTSVTSAADLSFDIPPGYTVEQVNSTSALLRCDADPRIIISVIDSVQFSPTEMINGLESQGYSVIDTNTYTIDGKSVTETILKIESGNSAGFVYSFEENGHEYGLTTATPDKSLWDIESPSNPANKIISSIN